MLVLGEASGCCEELEAAGPGSLLRIHGADAFELDGLRFGPDGLRLR